MMSTPQANTFRPCQSPSVVTVYGRGNNDEIIINSTVCLRVSHRTDDGGVLR